MRMFRVLLLVIGACGAALAAEPAATVRIPQAKLQQLKRLEPVTAQTIQVLVEAGQLDRAQADLVRRFTGPDGVVKLPDAYIGEAAVAPAPPPVATPGPTPLIRQPDGSLDVLAYLMDDDRRGTTILQPRERQRVEGNLKGYSHVGEADREAIRLDLHRIGAPVNLLVAAIYNDPVDLAVKAELWAATAGPHNPRAAGYIAATHQQAIRTANPVLIPYDTDAGGLILRRKDGRDQPLSIWYTSRELREMILDLEKAVSYCAGPRAAVYLMDVYIARYSGAEAPMRDKTRDRERLVRACGGDPKDFDDGKPETWGGTLGPLDRALIGERLAPQLRSAVKDVREIARYGMLAIAGQPDKKLRDFLKDAYKDWPTFERWWGERREELLKGAQ